MAQSFSQGIEQHLDTKPPFTLHSSDLFEHSGEIAPVDFAQPASDIGHEANSHPGIVSLFGSVNGACFARLHLPVPVPSSLVAVLDHRTIISPNIDYVNSGPFLPEHEFIVSKVDSAFASVFSYWPILARPFVDDSVKLLYTTRPFGTNKVQWDHLALLYSILALGQFIHDAETISTMEDVESVPIEGKAWFQKAVSLVRPQDCNRNLVALHATLCCTLYLLLSGALAQSDAYMQQIATAVMQLELDQPSTPEMTKYERYTRERTYLACQLIDAYIAILTGNQRRLRAPSPVPSSAHSHESKELGGSHAVGTLQREMDLVNVICDFRDASILPGDACQLDAASLQELDQNLQSTEQAMRHWHESIEATKQSIHASEGASEQNEEHHTITGLQAQMAYARARIVTYFPFLPLFFEQLNTHEFMLDYAMKCVEAAGWVVNAAVSLAAYGALPACTVHTLALASTSLLAFEVGGTSWRVNELGKVPDRATHNAYSLLKALGAAHPGTNEYCAAMAVSFFFGFGNTMLNLSQRVYDLLS